jgi:hypothetical protein
MDLIHQGTRRLITQIDIDGIVSAMMLSKVSEWKIAAAVIDSAGKRVMRVHPSYNSALDIISDGAFGVDVFSTLFPNASNHPVLWGTRKLRGDPVNGAIAAAYDAEVKRRSAHNLFLNPSVWVEIQTGHLTRKALPTALPYKYPLGTAQILLAALEIAGLSPKMFDREFLPYLLANCDGGLETIRKFPWNVPMWWSAIAAAAGPASLSEHIFQLAMNQRPDEFLGVTYKLGYQNQSVANALTSTWNLTHKDAATLQTVVHWVEDLSGWPDPFLGGVQDFSSWNQVSPPQGALALSGQVSFPGIGPALTTSTTTAFFWHLQGMLDAVYMSSFVFRNRSLIGWMLPG